LGKGFNSITVDGTNNGKLVIPEYDGENL